MLAPTGFRLLLLVLVAAPFCLLVTAGGCHQDASQSATTAIAADELPSDDELRDMLDDALIFTARHRKLSAERNAGWQILHGVLAYGRQFPIDTESGQVEATAWLMQGNSLSGWTLRKGEQGVRAVVEEGTKTGQGHEDQWLAVLAQCGYSSQDVIVVGDQSYTVGDLVEQARYDMWEGKEASWTLIGLSTYLPLDAQWPARDGGTWNLERIMAMEAAQDVNSSACGGSHRLMGMNYALKRYRAAHPDAPLSGGWQAAQERIRWGIDTARSYQSPTGALSVHYFQRPGDSDDPLENLGATGHTIELLAMSLSDEELRAPWVTKAVVYLCDLLNKTRPFDLECGALYHAAHGLVLYRERRFGPREYLEPVAKRDAAPASSSESSAVQ